MHPKKPKTDNQVDLFRIRLESFINLKHPLVLLSDRMDWEKFEDTLGVYYHPATGRPGIPTRLMVGLHYLKHTYDESDESVIHRWIENPYWQYFCGNEYLQHEFPIDR